MTIDRNLLDKIRSRGEQVLSQVSAELMSNPRFLKAIEGAMKGREKLEEAAAEALRQMNVSTRTELRRANSRIEALEREVAELRARGASPAGPSRGARRPAAKGTAGAAKPKAASRPTARRGGAGRSGSAG
jgi:polyhydroxyalkanoate synthesis regulator phasin